MSGSAYCRLDQFTTPAPRAVRYYYPSHWQSGPRSRLSWKGKTKAPCYASLRTDGGDWVLWLSSKSGVRWPCRSILDQQYPLMLNVQYDVALEQLLSYGEDMTKAEKLEVQVKLFRRRYEKLQFLHGQQKTDVRPAPLTCRCEINCFSLAWNY